MLQEIVDGLECLENPKIDTLKYQSGKRYLRLTFY